MAMKMSGRVGFDRLDSPKRLPLEDDALEDEGLDLVSTGVALDPQVTHLKHPLAMVKGELGSCNPDAPYKTVHGCLQGA
jgi:hypothetical protein